MYFVSLWIERWPGDESKVGYVEVPEREADVRSAYLKRAFRTYWSAAEVRRERFYYEKIPPRKLWVRGEGAVWHRYVGQDHNGG
jgi:hypothetical protein